MKVSIVLAVLTALAVSTALPAVPRSNLMFDCSKGATCADNQPMTFHIPGHDEVHCCESAFQGYSVSISKLGDKVQASCKCYTSFIG